MLPKRLIMIMFCVLLFDWTAVSQGPREQPLRPIEEIRSEALRASPPTEKGNFRKPDLVELSVWDPQLKFDIRYATSNNFLGTPVYGEPRAFLQRPAANALLRVDHKLRTRGFGLLIFDAYRPWFVTKIFWDATLAENHSYVSNPAKGSRHNRGCAVDLTLFDLKTGNPVPMPTGFDDFSERAWPNYMGGTDAERRHREILRNAMESEGFTVLSTEWWHYDYKDWESYQILNLPFSELFANRRMSSTRHPNQ